MTSPDRRRRRLAALAAALPTLLLLAALGAAEVVTRLTLPHVETLDALVTAPEQQFSFSDRESVRIFEGDPLLAWRLQPSLRDRVWDFTIVSTNAQSLRHPRPLEPKPRGGFRIVCVGDSVTFGYRVPVVFPLRPTEWDHRQQPYARLMEDALRAANPGRAIEVIALGVPGYSSHQGLAWLRHTIDALEPDAVTWCFGWNDASLRGRSDADSMPDDAWHVALRSAAIRSQAFLHASAWLRSHAPARGAPDGAVARVSTEDFAANALAMADLVRRHHAVPLVVATVYRDADTYPQEANRIGWHRDALRRAVQSAGVPWLLIPELTEEAWPGNDALFGESVHPNALGHRLMADRILAALNAAGALPGLVTPRVR